MAGEEDKRTDFYAVLGLNKACSALDLRNAYKKLALRWHPDRRSASGNSEEAKTKFQAIQEAYSVLSDKNKRFLYDVGAYDCDDEDDEDGMGEFLGEMAVMMNQTKPCENGEQSFEDLKTLFDDMFEKDLEAFDSASQSSCPNSTIDILSSPSNLEDDVNSNNKRNCSGLNSEKSKVDFNMESLGLRNFCFGVEGESQSLNGSKGNGRRTGRKQKVSSQADVSSSHGSKISV